jgi:hypothetical protein
MSQLELAREQRRLEGEFARVQSLKKEARLMMAPLRIFAATVAAFGLLLAIAARAPAQTVACEGVTQGSCVPVVKLAPGAAPFQTPVAGVVTGADTSSAAASLAATTDLTNYLCDFSVTGLGATAINNAAVTVAGLAGGNVGGYQQ